MINAPKLPEVSFTKNGYQLRTEILEMAKGYVTDDFRAKFQGWEMTTSKEKDGKLVTTVSMPEFPGLDKILETAEAMYSFVNQTKK